MAVASLYVNGMIKWIRLLDQASGTLSLQLAKTAEHCKWYGCIVSPRQRSLSSLSTDLWSLPAGINQIVSCCIGLQDKTVVVITSGPNMNFDLCLVSELADIGALREAMLATSIPESPGSFRGFIDTALADTNQSVTEFKYRCGAEKTEKPGAV